MIQHIADINGLQVIKAKLIEECEELIEAIQENDELHIIEEIADTIIVAQQYIYKTDNDQEYNKVRDYKIARTLRRLKWIKTLNKELQLEL